MSWQRRKTSRACAPAPAESPVVMAISNNDRKHLSRLLADGANPDAPHRDTCAMVFAARRGELDVIDLLRAHNGNINQQDGNGMTALMVAASSAQYGLAHALIARGANLNICDRNGLTALIHAAVKQDHDAVDILIRAGADTQIGFKDGKTLADYLNQPDNNGLKATFDASQKQAAQINTAVAARVTVRKPLQIKHK